MSVPLSFKVAQASKTLKAATATATALQNAEAQSKPLYENGRFRPQLWPLDGFREACE
jgi:hypothetical protein